MIPLNLSLSSPQQQVSYLISVPHTSIIETQRLPYPNNDFSSYQQLSYTMHDLITQQSNNLLCTNNTLSSYPSQFQNYISNPQQYLSTNFLPVVQNGISNFISTVSQNPMQNCFNVPSPQYYILNTNQQQYSQKSYNQSILQYQQYENVVNESSPLHSLALSSSTASRSSIFPMQDSPLTTERKNSSITLTKQQNTICKAIDSTLQELIIESNIQKKRCSSQSDNNHLFQISKSKFDQTNNQPPYSYSQNISEILISSLNSSDTKPVQNQVDQVLSEISEQKTKQDQDTIIKEVSEQPLVQKEKRNSKKQQRNQKRISESIAEKNSSFPNTPLFVQVDGENQKSQLNLQNPLIRHSKKKLIKYPQALSLAKNEEEQAKIQLIEDLDTDQRLILRTAIQTNRQNINRNLIKQFKSFVNSKVKYTLTYEKSSEQNYQFKSCKNAPISINNNPTADESYSFFKKFNKFIATKHHSNNDIKQIIENKIYGFLFLELLTTDIDDWIEENIVDRKSDYRCIVKFYILCCQNIQYLQFMNDTFSLNRKNIYYFNSSESHRNNFLLEDMRQEGDLKKSLIIECKNEINDQQNTNNSKGVNENYKFD